MVKRETMRDFIAEYIERLQRRRPMTSPSCLTGSGPNKMKSAIPQEAINRELRLDGEFALNPDLPCQSVGSRKGLLLLLVNPGWGAELNLKEDAYCRRSKEHYRDLMFQLLHSTPASCRHSYRFFTAQTIPVVGVLHDGAARVGHAATEEAR